MSIIALPFMLIWIGVKIDMPMVYYVVIGIVTLIDIIMGIAGETNGNDKCEERENG